jgi:hypothetical protein
VTVNSRLYFVFDNDGCKFLLQFRGSCVECSGHLVHINSDKRTEVLSEGLSSDAFINGVNMVMKVHVEQEVIL